MKASHHSPTPPAVARLHRCRAEREPLNGLGLSRQLTLPLQSAGIERAVRAVRTGRRPRSSSLATCGMRVDHAVITHRNRRAEPFRAALSFLWRHWRRHLKLLAVIVGGMIVATLADVLVPIFAGRLVDALADSGAGRAGPRWDRPSAPLRPSPFSACSCWRADRRHSRHRRPDPSGDERRGAEAFHGVQRFSADWHANSFAGSTVRRISRGMWAIDLLDDTILIALLPSGVVLLGATALLGWRWPPMGALVAAGGLFYVALTVALSLRWVAPAARLSNAWDTKLGGAMADAIGANAVVKAFAAEAREDARLSAVIEWLADDADLEAGHSRRGTADRHPAAPSHRRRWVRPVPVVARAGRCGGSRDRAHHVLHGPGLFARCRIPHQQSAAGRQRDGGAGGPARHAARDRGPARCAVVGRHSGRDCVRACHLLVWRASDAPLPRPRSPHPLRRKRWARRPLGLRQDDPREAHPAASRRDGRPGHDRRAGCATCNQASLRARIAIVQQEPVLFHRSLAENIAYAKPGATLQEIRRAAALANADDFITRMPRGWRRSWENAG